MTKVSIVMSVFNSQKTIRRTMESILCQTLEDWELIIIDDCSSDNTSIILASYGENDRRIKIIRNEQNLGLAVSLNKGVVVASADLVARMDGDDEMLPQRLEKQVSFMCEHPEIGLLGSGAYLVDAQGHHLGLSLPPETHTEIYKTIKFRNPIMHPTVVIRRELLLKEGYLERLRRKQDYELWSRLIEKTLFHNLQEPLIKYSTNYKKSISTILSGLYVSCWVALRFRSIRGIFSAFLCFVSSVAIKFNLYTPNSIRGSQRVMLKDSA